MGAVDGRVALVTGASRGQGAAEAQLLAQEGAKVVLTDIDEAGAQTAAAIGTDACFLHHDVSDAVSWGTIVAATLKRFGQLDILVNNAAIYKPRGLQDTTIDDFEAHYRVNQLGAFLGMGAVVDAMKRARSGSIINISSVAALRGSPGAFAYSATKWALRGMTRCAAVDLAPLSIRVNAIFPGIIDTRMLEANSADVLRRFPAMIPMGRFGTVWEVARVVAFLASDAAAYITGAEINVDGGIGA
jgi:3alpha(or 20beta)-hydroxysteroid dehydrogenase